MFQIVSMPTPVVIFVCAWKPSNCLLMWLKSCTSGIALADADNMRWPIERYTWKIASLKVSDETRLNKFHQKVLNRARLFLILYIYLLVIVQTVSHGLIPE